MLHVFGTSTGEAGHNAIRVTISEVLSIQSIEGPEEFEGPD